MGPCCADSPNKVLNHSCWIAKCEKKKPFFYANNLPWSRASLQTIILATKLSHCIRNNKRGTRNVVVGPAATGGGKDGGGGFLSKQATQKGRYGKIIFKVAHQTWFDQTGIRRRTQAAALAVDVAPPNYRDFGLRVSASQTLRPSQCLVLPKEAPYYA